ncbi:MAG: hypothetical protein J6S58_04330 [Lentisphaeria bacterium]|nr:hypothetical protein [Lentisphaeria bacterium]
MPDYDRFRLLSTGAIDKDHLTEVDTDEKEQAAANMFSDACILYPESGSTSHGRSGNIPLPITLPLEQINEIIRKEIEAKSLDFPDFTYAMKRLKRLEAETRHENYSRWGFLLARLENNMRSINRYQSPEGYLLCQMLRSAIYCHMGQTDQALAWNQKAKDFARANGFEKHLCRLGIEELVEFQDLEDFYTVKVLSSQIASEVEKLKDDDLKMRYSGTMGQACAYGFLAGIKGFTESGKEESLRYFQTAAECAFRLGAMDDAAQDLNYIHLWHALFEPGTPEENLAAKEAADHIRLQIKNSESRKKHEYFLRRQRAFAQYRSCLLNKELQSFDSVRSLRLPKNSAEGWLFAVTNKYIAAVLASCGHAQDAKEYFDEALEVLTPNSRHNIIDFIRMTVLAEGYHSLHLTEYKDAALKALSLLPETPSSRKWKSYLGTGENYPALQYWY